MSPVGGGKPGSCGKLTPGHEAKIVNPETGQVLGANQPGEICLKGGAMKGYINDPVKTRETIDSDGFVHTGDLGYYDEDFDFFVIDRLKDLIKYKSFQVAPLEIEQILLQHHGVKDVAVVGKPDDRFGELPVAFVVQRERAQVEESEILEHVRKYVCVEKQLHGGVRFVEEIPRNAIGKILRKQLRDML
jgi:4-coumarate--CoA ligase